MLYMDEQRTKRQIVEQCIDITTGTLLTMVRDISDGKLVDSRLEVLLASIVRATNCGAAIKRLYADRPFSEEMHTLLRSLAELVINASYLQIAPEKELESYLKYDSIMLAKTIRLAGEVRPEVLERISQTTRDAFAKHVDEVMLETGDTISGTSWTKLDLHSRGVAVDKHLSVELFQFLSRVLYPSGHSYTHSTYSSLRGPIETFQTGEYNEVAVKEDANLALFGTAQALHVFAMSTSLIKGIDTNVALEVVQNLLQTGSDMPG
ncbi:MAG: hypothetical protein JWQ49_105 [Edaphobacter sp.]|nr:hypothetical protein [Edaphobacter sp.]